MKEVFTDLSRNQVALFVKLIKNAVQNIRTLVPADCGCLKSSIISNGR